MNRTSKFTHETDQLFKQEMIVKPHYFVILKSVKMNQIQTLTSYENQSTHYFTDVFMF